MPGVPEQDLSGTIAAGNKPLIFCMGTGGDVALAGGGAEPLIISQSLSQSLMPNSPFHLSFSSPGFQERIIQSACTSEGTGFQLSSLHYVTSCFAICSPSSEICPQLSSLLMSTPDLFVLVCLSLLPCLSHFSWLISVMISIINIHYFYMSSIPFLFR